MNRASADEMILALRDATGAIRKHCGTDKLSGLYDYEIVDYSDSRWKLSGDEVLYTLSEDDQIDDAYAVSLYGGRRGHPDSRGKPQGEPIWRGTDLVLLLVRRDNGGDAFLMLVRADAEQA